MKLLTLTTLLTPSLALIASSHPNTATYRLTKRAASWCGVYTLVEATTSTSPLVSDCQALVENNLPGNWYPSAPDNYTFSFEHGACGFRTVYNPDGGSLAITDMEIRPDMVDAVLTGAIDRAVDGRVGATGNFMCLLAGMATKTGWAKFEIYSVEPKPETPVKCTQQFLS